MVQLIFFVTSIVVATATVVSGHVIDDGHEHHDHLHPSDHHDHHHQLRVSRDDQSLLQFLNQSTSNDTSSSGRDERKRCNAKDPTSEEIAKSLQVVQKWMTNAEFREKRQGVIITVPTYIHVLYNGTTGVVTDEEVQATFNVLNEAFSPYNFAFILMSTTRTESLDWYNAQDGSQDEEDMFSALRVGDASTLNIYLNGGGGYFGYATFPSWYTEYPKEDGVVLFSETIPGGDEIDYNNGKILVHEVGHWLGLYHTFQPDYFKRFGLLRRLLSRFVRNYEDCYYNDDGVDDTPKQAFPTVGCPDSQDSCPFSAGQDPVNNYMDYSIPECFTEFTPGQMDRMQAMWYEYRA